MWLNIDFKRNYRKSWRIEIFVRWGKGLGRVDKLKFCGHFSLDFLNLVSDLNFLNSVFNLRISFHTQKSFILEQLSPDLFYFWPIEYYILMRGVLNYINHFEDDFTQFDPNLAIISNENIVGPNSNPISHPQKNQNQEME